MRDKTSNLPTPTLSLAPPSHILALPLLPPPPAPPASLTSLTLLLRCHLHQPTHSHFPPSAPRYFTLSTVANTGQPLDPPNLTHKHPHPTSPSAPAPPLPRPTPQLSPTLPACSHPVEHPFFTTSCPASTNTLRRVLSRYIYTASSPHPHTTPSPTPPFPTASPHPITRDTSLAIYTASPICY